MKKHLPAANNRLLFNKERVRPLSPEDLDKITGGFQVEPHECPPTSLVSADPCSPLGGHFLLTLYDPKFLLQPL